MCRGANFWFRGQLLIIVSGILWTHFFFSNNFTNAIATVRSSCFVVPFQYCYTYIFYFPPACYFPFAALFDFNFFFLSIFMLLLSFHIFCNIDFIHFAHLFTRCRTLQYLPRIDTVLHHVKDVTVKSCQG